MYVPLDRKGVITGQHNFRWLASTTNRLSGVYHVTVLRRRGCTGVTNFTYEAPQTEAESIPRNPRSNQILQQVRACKFTYSRPMYTKGGNKVAVEDPWQAKSRYHIGTKTLTCQSSGQERGGQHQSCKLHHGLTARCWHSAQTR